MLGKSLIAKILIGVLALSVLTGCKPTQTQTQQKTEEVLVVEPVKQEMNWNIGAEPKILDPQMNSAFDASHVINNTFSGLMRDHGDEIRPELIEKYELSNDKLTYTFYLKESQWSDGKPLTAYDFEYSWKRALDPNEGIEYAFQLFYLKGGQAFNEGTGSVEEVGVKAINDYILEVTLIAPTPYFIDLTAFMTYMPVRKDVIELAGEGDWSDNPELFVSSGPFVLSEYTPGEGLVLKKNEHYINAEKVVLETINVFFDPDSERGLELFEDGNLDIFDTPPVTKIAELEAENPDFYIFPHAGTFFYYINISNPIFKDIKVRKALSLAVDRNAIVTSVTKAGQLPATGIVPYGIYDSSSEEFRVKAGEYGISTEYADVEMARGLLADAGYPNGEGLPTIDVLVDNTGEHMAIAQFITEMWSEVLGINCTIVDKPWADVLQDRNDGTYSIARGGWIGDYSDPMTFLDLFLSYSGNNDSYWGNAEFDNLIEEAKLMSGNERSNRLYDAEQLLAENHVIIPIYYYTDPAMISERAKGWKRTGLGSWYFGDVEMTE